MDRPFLEQVWNWLVKNPDIRLGSHSRHKQLTLSQVEASNAAVERLEQSCSIAQETNPSEAVGSSQVAIARRNIQDSDIGQNQQTSKTASARKKGTATTERSDFNPGIRLYASQNRMWHALTGHGPDSSKVKSLDFICLSIIAAHGPNGIVQHDLVRISGQDKRSLPARTDRLHNDGYIEKRRVSVQLVNPSRVLHTSQCFLKRFINDSDQIEQTRDPGHSSTEKGKPKKKKGRQIQDKQAPEKSSSKAAPENLAEEIAPSGSRIIPSWTADRTLNNQIFELVDRAGTKGMSMTVRLHFIFPSDNETHLLIRCLGD